MDSSLIKAADRGDCEAVEWAKNVNSLKELPQAAPSFDHFKVVRRLPTDDLTALHIATSHGNIKTMKALLNSCANIDERTRTGGLTALHLAIFYRRTEAAKVLLDAGSDIGTRIVQPGQVTVTHVNQYFHGWTPLHVAAHSGTNAIVETLLNANAEIDARTPDGLRAVDIAVDKERFGIATTLLKAKLVNWIDDGSPTFHIAVRTGDCNVVENLLKSDPYIAGQTYLNRALHIAVELGHVKMIPLLLQAGAKRDAAISVQGKTAIHVAAERGHENIVRALLDADADIDARTIEGAETALHLAARNGHSDVVRTLLAANARVSVESKIGWRPLDEAAGHGCTAIVKIFLKGKVNIYPICDITSSLHHAIRQGHTEVVEIMRSELSTSGEHYLDQQRVRSLLMAGY